MEFQRRFLRGVVLACGTLLLSGFAGCGSSGGPSTHKVSGKVTTADGAPVSGASVAFTPSGKGFQATGTTGADGSYQLTTTEQNDGAAEGEYVIAVNAPDGATLPVLEGKEKVSVGPGANAIDIKVGPPVPGSATPPDEPAPEEAATTEEPATP